MCLYTNFENEDKNALLSKVIVPPEKKTYENLHILTNIRTLEWNKFLPILIYVTLLGPLRTSKKTLLT